MFYMHSCSFGILVLNVKFIKFFRYVIHLYEMNVDGVWENRSIYIYYTELIFELSAISIDFCHHLHMLVSFFFLCWYLYVKWSVFFGICMYTNLRDNFKNRLLLLEVKIAIVSEFLLTNSDSCWQWVANELVVILRELNLLQQFESI